MQGDSPGAVAALRAAPRTEQRNPRTADIDTVPTEEVLRLLNAEDATVPGAVASALPVLATVVDKVVECVRAGGQVHYFGAGTWADGGAGCGGDRPDLRARSQRVHRTPRRRRPGARQRHRGC